MSKDSGMKGYGKVMRWLTNTYNPSKPDYWMSIIPFHGQTYEEAEKMQRDFLQNAVIGRPKATDKYTVEQLEVMGMVGVYSND